MNLTKEERETVIRCSMADQEWDIVTADARMIGYLKRRGYVPGPDHQFSDPYVHFVVPFGKLRFARPEKRRATGKPFLSREFAQQNNRSPETDTEARGPSVRCQK